MEGWSIGLSIVPKQWKRSSLGVCGSSNLAREVNKNELEAPTPSRSPQRAINLTRSEPQTPVDASFQGKFGRKTDTERSHRSFFFVCKELFPLSFRHVWQMKRIMLRILTALYRVGAVLGIEFRSYPTGCSGCRLKLQLPFKPS